MIYSQRLPTRTFIKEVKIIYASHLKKLEFDVNEFCSKYLDIDKNEFISNISYLTDKHTYAAMITISKEKCYNDDNYEK